MNNPNRIIVSSTPSRCSFFLNNNLYDWHPATDIEEKTRKEFFSVYSLLYPLGQIKGGNNELFLVFNRDTKKYSIISEIFPDRKYLELPEFNIDFEGEVFIGVDLAQSLYYWRAGDPNEYHPQDDILSSGGIYNHTEYIKIVKMDGEIYLGQSNRSPELTKKYNLDFESDLAINKMDLMLIKHKAKKLISK